MLFRSYNNTMNEIRAGHSNIVIVYKTDDSKHIAVKFEPHSHANNYCRNITRKYIRELLSDVPNVHYIDNLINQSVGIQVQESDAVSTINYCSGTSCQEYLSPLNSMNGLCFMWCKYFQIFMLLNKDKQLSEIISYFEGKPIKKLRSIKAKVNRREVLNRNNEQYLLKQYKNIAMYIKTKQNTFRNYYNRIANKENELQRHYHESTNNTYESIYDKEQRLLAEIDEYKRQLRFHLNSSRAANTHYKTVWKPTYFDYIKTLDFHICIYLCMLFLYYKLYQLDIMNRRNYDMLISEVKKHSTTFIDTSEIPPFEFSIINTINPDDRDKIQNLFDKIIVPLLINGSDNLETRLLASAGSIFHLREDLPEDKHYCKDMLFEYGQFCLPFGQRKTPDPTNVQYIAKCGSGEQILQPATAITFHHNSEHRNTLIPTLYNKLNNIVAKTSREELAGISGIVDFQGSKPAPAPVPAPAPAPPPANTIPPNMATPPTPRKFIPPPLRIPSATAANTTPPNMATPTTPSPTGP